jgi:Tfp pilus assembly protein FimV
MTTKQANLSLLSDAELEALQAELYESASISSEILAEIANEIAMFGDSGVGSAAQAQAAREEIAFERKVSEEIRRRRGPVEVVLASDYDEDEIPF